MKTVPPTNTHRQLIDVHGDGDMRVHFVMKICRKFENGWKDIHENDQIGWLMLEILSSVQLVILCEFFKLSIQQPFSLSVTVFDRPVQNPMYYLTWVKVSSCLQRHPTFYHTDPFVICRKPLYSILTHRVIGYIQLQTRVYTEAR